jgi:hypothetical protein
MQNDHHDTPQLSICFKLPISIAMSMKVGAHAKILLHLLGYIPYLRLEREVTQNKAFSTMAVNQGTRISQLTTDNRYTLIVEQNLNCHFSKLGIRIPAIYLVVQLNTTLCRANLGSDALEYYVASQSLPH